MADTTQAAPGLGGNFAEFSDPSAGTYSAYAFIASDSTGKQGVYSSPGLGGVPPALVAKSGDSPLAGREFSGFGAVSTYTGEGEFTSNLGVFRFSTVGGFPIPNGALPPNPSLPAVIAPKALVGDVPVGGPGAFSEFGHPGFKGAFVPSAIQGNIRAFDAVRAVAGGVEGIYFGDAQFREPGAYQRLVDTTTTSFRQFTRFGDAAADPYYIAFSAHYQTGGGEREGIFYYGAIGNDEGVPPGPPPPALSQVVATGDLAPDGDGAHYADFLTVNVGVFLATLDDGRQGIYGVGNTSPNPFNPKDPTSVYKLIDTNDVLDGKDVTSLAIGPDALTGKVIFRATFADGSSGIYLLTGAIPEPAAAALAFGVVPLVRRRRRRRAGV